MHELSGEVKKRGPVCDITWNTCRGGGIAGQAACKYLIKTVCSVDCWALQVRERARNKLPSNTTTPRSHTTQVCSFGLKYLSDDRTICPDYSRHKRSDVKEAAPPSLFTHHDHFHCCRIIKLTLLYLPFGWTGSVMTMAPSTVVILKLDWLLWIVLRQHHEVQTHLNTMRFFILSDATSR